MAIAEKLTTENIARAIVPPKPDIRKIIPFTENEIKLMLGALEKSRPYTRPGKKLSDHSLPSGDRSRAILLLLLDTGLRAFELCEATIQQVDNYNHRLLVLGKGDNERLVQFSSRNGLAMWRYLTSPPDAGPTNPLFSTQDGHPMDRDNLRHVIERIGECAKIDDVHPHRFRHTFAIQFLRNGGDPFTWQILPGHSRMKMVKHYRALAQTDMEAAHRKASPVDHWRL